MKKLLMVGLGDLGGHVLELLCSARVPIRIVASDIAEESGYRKTNLVQYVAGQMGFDTNIDFRKIDLYNIEETAGIISHVSPDIIFTSASLQSCGSLIYCRRKSSINWIRHALGLGYPCI